MEAILYNQKGSEAGKITLPEAVFGLPWNADLVHQVAVSMASNERNPIAHTKTRGEVSGTGRKPWRQKGTGQARHGSRRSPIWRTGGVAHGPRNDKNFDRKVNRKMKAKALCVILSKKWRDGEVLFIESVAMDVPKTSTAKEILASVAKGAGAETMMRKRKNAAYVALGKKDAAVEKSFRNFGNIEVDELRNLNPLDLLQNKYLVISDAAAALTYLESKVTTA
jgi:large subunit ribosomal protein L4